MQGGFTENIPGICGSRAYAGGLQDALVAERNEAESYGRWLPSGAPSRMRGYLAMRKRHNRTDIPGQG